MAGKNSGAAWPDERSARRELADTAREIYDRRLSGASDGNLSIRLGPDRIAATPSGGHKGRLKPDDIVLVDLQGKPIGTRGKRRPSSEIALHIAAYSQRPDVGAVIHAHPPMAIAYQLAGGRLSEVLVSEVVFACGQIATARYTTPTTAQVPEVLSEFLRCYDVVLLARHGSVTLGSDLETALVRLDALEHTAHVYAAVRMMGGAEPIPAAEVDRLFAIAQPQVPPYRRPEARCPAPEPTDMPQVSQDGDNAALVQAVLRALASPGGRGGR